MSKESIFRIRPAAVAGSFYAADPAVLAADVQVLLDAAPQGGPRPKVIIAPHAGYVYSGGVAASAYATIGSARGSIERVVLLGPSHRAPLRGMALPSVDAFETALGTVLLDQAGLAALRALPGVRVADAPHERDHALEVQLPFLQRQLGRFSLLPVAIGDCAAELVADVLDCVWGGPETLIVVSTDLSHFHPYEEALAIDRDTVARILRRESSLRGDQACGCHALNGLLTLAHRRELQLRLLDYKNSGDTAGDHSRVVGYASFVIDAT